MFCRNCGAQVQDADSFCQKCGANSSVEAKATQPVTRKKPGRFHRFCVGALSVWTALWAGLTLSMLANLSNIAQQNEWAMAGMGLGLMFYGVLWFLPSLVLGILAIATRPGPGAAWSRGAKWVTALLCVFFFLWPFALHTSKTPSSGSASDQPSFGSAASSPAQDQGWSVSIGKSDMDGSATVVLNHEAESNIQGWLESKRPSLVIRCKEKHVDVYVDTGMTASVEGTDNEHTVRIRMDDKPAFTQSWSESTDGNALFAPSPRNLARNLSHGSTMLFEFVPFQANPVTAKFDLTGLDKLLPQVEAACP